MSELVPWGFKKSLFDKKKKKKKHEQTVEDILATERTLSDRKRQTTEMSRETGTKIFTVKYPLPCSASRQRPKWLFLSANPNERKKNLVVLFFRFWKHSKNKSFIEVLTDNFQNSNGPEKFPTPHRAFEKEDEKRRTRRRRWKKKNSPDASSSLEHIRRQGYEVVAIYITQSLQHSPRSSRFHHVPSRSGFPESGTWDVESLIN